MIKTKHFIFILAISIIFLAASIYALLIVQKGGQLHKWNSQHYIGVDQLGKALTEFENEIKQHKPSSEKVKNSLSHIESAVAFIKRQPAKCLEEINYLDKAIMRFLQTTQIIRLCQKDIQEAESLEASINAYKKDNISGAQLSRQIALHRSLFMNNSNQFVRPVEKTVNFMFSLAIAVVLLFGTLSFTALFFVLARLRKKHAESQIILTMPEQNPFPVIRLGKDNYPEYANNAGQEFLKSVSGESGKNTYEFPVHLQNKIQECGQSGLESYFEITHGCKTYAIRLVPDKDYGHINIYAHDVTDYHDILQELEESKAYIEHIVNHSPALIAGLAPDGTTNFVNPRLCEVTGYSKEELIGKNWWKTLFPGSAFHQVNELLENNFFIDYNQIRDYELELVTKSGEIRRIKWDSLNEYDENGDLVQVFGFGIDITRQEQSEERLNIVSDNVSSFIAYIDKQGRYQYINGFFADYIGLPPEYITGQRVLDIHNKSNLDKILKIFKQAMEGQTINIDTYFIHAKSGEKIYVLGSVTPDISQTGDVKGLYLIAQDVTKERESFQKLMEFKNTLDQLQDMVFIIDPETMQFLYVNKGACKTLGYSEKELLERGLEDIDVGYLEKQMASVLETGNISKNGPLYKNMQVSFINRQGEHIPFNLTVEYLRPNEETACIMGIARDIRKDRETLDKLKNQKKQMELSEQIAGLGHWRYDCKTREVSWSEQVYKIHGISPETHTPDIDSALDFYHPEDINHVKRNFSNAVYLGEQCFFEARIIRADGEIVHVKSWGRPEKDDKGNVVRVFGVLQDITEEKKRAENEHARQKLEAMGQMAAGAAHEINNALQPVILMSENLKDLLQNTKDSRIFKMLDMVINNAHNARVIVDDMLKFSRRDSREREFKSLQTILARAIEFTCEFLPASITVKKHGLTNPDQADPGFGVGVYVDETEFIQIITNLVNNANHAMAGRGVLEFDASIEKNKKAESDHFVRISVRDSGQGMDEKTQQNIFEPFFTTKDVGKGTGLGMSTVYGIIRDLGGEIHIDSAQGQGTTITLFLPCKTEQEAKHA